MSSLEAIRVWGQGGPNPPKIAFILEELNLTYDFEPIAMADVKTPAYLKINPNGRLPSINDPNNNDLTLWESGAIVEYLVDRYDKDRKISFERGTSEDYLCKQWLFFQTTGQAPYYGQAAWFKKFHHEQLPSAIERYVKEIHRVSGVLNEWLAQEKQKHPNSGSNGPWLVGDRMTYADLSFVSWQKVVAMMFSKDEYDVEKFPHLKQWLDKMNERESVTKVWDAAMKSMGRH